MIASCSARAVRIVLAQDFTDYEIVIVDEGSEHKPQAAIADLLEPRNPWVLRGQPPYRRRAARAATVGRESMRVTKSQVPRHLQVGRSTTTSRWP